MTPAEMRAYIEEAPLPGDGPGSWEPHAKMGGYDGCARSLAHALLVLIEEDPTLLEVPSREDDPTGAARADNEKLWKAFKARWPEGNDWLGGPSVFQYGWAHNAVRYIVGAEAVSNPAMGEIFEPVEEARGRAGI
jgi:hypothetical protein